MSKKYLSALRKARREMEYSQEYVANQLGISQKAYSDIENGKTELKNEIALKLSKLLNINLEIVCPVSGACRNLYMLKNRELIKLLIQNNIDIPKHLL